MVRARIGSMFERTGICMAFTCAGSIPRDIKHLDSGEAKETSPRGTRCEVMPFIAVVRIQLMSEVGFRIIHVTVATTYAVI